MRGATLTRPPLTLVTCFNSRPSCEGRRCEYATTEKKLVSIHAPHARGDKTLVMVIQTILFQFTPLMRGATGSEASSIRRTCFNSRPSCEGRHAVAGVLLLAHVSIHAPHARGDQEQQEQFLEHMFQFTPLMRGATSYAFYEIIRKVVSIHAPHARGDLCSSRFVASRSVSIHAPHARGDTEGHFTMRGAVFQFTPLMRGATPNSRATSEAKRFNSRPSCEGRPRPNYAQCADSVSIHAPHARGDQ